MFDNTKGIIRRNKSKKEKKAQWQKTTNNDTENTMAKDDKQ